MGKAVMNYAMHRGPVKRHRPLFPLPWVNLGRSRSWQGSHFASFCLPHFAELSAEEIWARVAVLGLNGTAGFGRADLQRKATAMQLGALCNIKHSISRVLSLDCTLERSQSEAEKELSNRFDRDAGTFN